MASSAEWTYKSLIKPIAPSYNLANIAAQEPIPTCQSCAAIVPDRRKAVKGLVRIDYERIDLYPDFPRLKASAKSGCGLCRLIRKTIRTKWATRPMEEWGVGPLREKEGLWDELFEAPWDRKVKIHNLTFSLQNLSNPSSTPLNIMLLAQQDNHNGMVVSFGLEFGPATLLNSSDGTALHGEIGQQLGFTVYDSQDINSTKKEYQRRLPSLSTLSEANLELISNWISDCKSFHSKCRLDESVWVPTRLLYVGGSEDPRLIESVEEGVQEPYAALSHMWGDPSQLSPLQTILSKYEDMKIGISMWQLSKNFLDAVIVTRQLGLRYIWIDSLCIIQDSSTDWQKEAVMMHKVYRYAEVTIVATSATSAHDGFLDRDLSMIPAAKIKYSLNDEPSTSDSFILSTYDDVESETILGDLYSCQWNCRGWTHQERSLSTRMLHFCKSKLYFECRTCLRSEENEPLEDRPRFQLWPRYEDWMKPSSGSESENENSLLRTRMYKIWTATVMEYSQRRLTKDSDKLPAIRSIAAEMAAAINDAYIDCAGMWRGNINHDLLWHVRDGPRSIPANYRAPSWSWASIDAKIGWTDGPIQRKASHSSVSSASFEVLDVADISVGVTKSPFLKVKAYLKPLAFITECDNNERWVYGSRGTFPYDLHITTETSTSTGALKHSDSVLPLKERQPAIEKGLFAKFAEGSLDQDDKDGLTDSQCVFSYLHVNHMSRPSGLILEPVSNRDDVWKRVGIATVFSMKSDLFFEPCFHENDCPAEITVI